MEAIVVLPLPETPITTRTEGNRGSAATTLLRRRGAVDEPDQRAIRPGARGGQIFACKHAGKNFALFGPAHNEQHLARRGERGEGQGHWRAILLQVRFFVAARPT